MYSQQNICKFCISVRTFSSFQAICKIPVGARVILRSKSLNKKQLIVSNNFLTFLRHKTKQHDIWKYHTPSLLENQAEVFRLPSENVTNDASTEINYTKHLYKNIIQSFPDGIQMAFAYGSGAIEQLMVKDKSKNMLDFIFVVDNPQQWHESNLKKHPNHYSFLKRFGPDGLTKIQDSYGAGVYFNTFVPMNGRLIKYGVISTARLITDLLDWESLYISGRLHKPVSLIILPKDENLLEALIVNLQSAVHTALLLLPDTFTEEQLYLTIAGLSYSGDIRMSLAEDNNKVQNIVMPNIWHFRRMYLPIIMKEDHVVFMHEGSHIEQALNFESRHHHLSQLPCKVLQGLVLQKYEVGLFPDMEEIICQRAFDKECGSRVCQSITNIVKSSSAAQTLKGFFTAGFFKSIRYAMSKVTKKAKSI